MSGNNEVVVKRERPSTKWLTMLCRDNRDTILSMWADQCMSFDAIAKKIQSEMPGVLIEPSMLRFSFLSDPYLHGAYNAAAIDRSHTLAEQVLEHANDCAKTGDFDKAAAIKLKLAGKYSPRHYGDRIDSQPDPFKIAPRQVEGVPDAVLEDLVKQDINQRRQA